jgi:hypothetical protein
MKLSLWLLLFGLIIASVYGQESGEDDSGEDDSGEDDGESDTTTSSTSSTSSTTSGPQLDNNVESNYYYDSFNGIVYFPYALDQCTATSISSTYMKASCVDDTHLSVVRYSGDDTCTDEDSVVQTNTYNTSQASFRCTGTSDYVSVQISPFGCDQLDTTVYAALSECIDSGSVYVSAYCLDNYAELQYYLDATCSTFYTKFTTTDECSSSPFITLSTGTQLYGKLVSCTQTTANVPDTTQPESSSIVHFNIAGLFVAALLAALKL